jgi:integration host factor subunit alpha|tara:strand:- start:339 stop:611 length:273 start_codon:yes stop_codon:yes gene_type:complete
VGLGKKDIVNNISSKTLISSKDSLKILDSFLCILKKHKNKNIKLAKFGSFLLINTPRRIGRNPKTKKEYEIRARKKLTFKASNKIKSFLN